MTNLIHDVVKFLVDFVFLTVGLKIIVGHWIAEIVERYANKFFRNAQRNERVKAIWDHYQARAKNAGHTASDVLACVEGKCAIL